MASDNQSMTRLALEKAVRTILRIESERSSVDFASSDRIITHEAFLVETVRTKLSGLVAVNSVIMLFQRNI